MKNIYLALTLLLFSASAHAMKCEVTRGQDGADCDYRAYVHGQKIDLYASDCEYSDDNGGPATYEASKLSHIKGAKYSLDTGASPIVLTCEK